jgi:hypothetical protein
MHAKAFVVPEPLRVKIVRISSRRPDFPYLLEGTHC